MTDVRELLARLNPTNIRMDVGMGGGTSADSLTNIDIAGALGMVPAGLGRDLFELLHGPDPGRGDILRVLEGVTRMVLEERNRRSKDYADARATWGIAECMARFNRDREERTVRHLDILKARVAVARDRLWPERLEERLPEIATVAIGYMKGERLSNRERATVVGVSESAYRQVWVGVVDWLLTQMVEAEAAAVRKFAQAVSQAAA
ncbi:hypothetical protein [Stenotrophomonas sp. NLF4-10]|uniref:hypothetical protein n=1 Tax=Stenotrophomonas sp. NLF4-10 TaxID=2918754 RepID=UPI001EFBF091|nr:hypothetical protein [Stenotrophomonas sp. NLF4-10]MCG8275389.1 hypothetical protein [Stenotrophomonas sp. NLF4-10]